MVTKATARMPVVTIPAVHGPIYRRKIGIACTLLILGNRMWAAMPIYEPMKPTGNSQRLANMLAFFASCAFGSELMVWMTYCVANTAPRFPIVQAKMV